MGYGSASRWAIGANDGAVRSSIARVHRDDAPIENIASCGTMSRMAQAHSGITPRPPATAIARVRHLRAPEPLHFPETELMPEGKRHLALRTFLWQLLEFALGPEHAVGSEQFIYWNGNNPKRKLAPDVFVCLGIPNSSFGSWKTWERRTPDLAIEIISPTEDDGIDWDEKFARYHELGIGELVRFDPMAPEGQRLRIWDRVEHDLVEREVQDDSSPCLTLGLNWAVTPVEGEPVGLRLAREDGSLVLNKDETKDARIRELEEELRRRS